MNISMATKTLNNNKYIRCKYVMVINYLTSKYHNGIYHYENFTIALISPVTPS